MGKNIFFNAHHSPMGAFSSFTLGYHGNGGGLTGGNEKNGPE
ncbi:hypothetical protein QUF79_04605 [Fictibacillus enclensis]|nr:hypothetical protein [Fictibacillus enclensis]MDM5197310.1 hypothetical protein [Fictibacillus enclensis]